MKPRALPGWFLWSVAVAVGAHLLAGYFTDLTIGAMGSVSEFAREVRRRDLAFLAWWKPVSILAGVVVATIYVWPVLRYERHGGTGPVDLARRRAVNAPVVIALIGLAAWTFGSLAAVAATILRFGHWSVELMSQHVWSPLVNSFLAVTTSYLLIDWTFRARVIPRLFAGADPAAVPGSIAPGVSARLLITLVAVAFIPLFTMLGLVRAAVVRFRAGMPVEEVMPDLARASAITFGVFLVLGVGLALIFARSLTGRLRDVARALRAVRAGRLDLEVPVTSADEVGVLEGGVNSMVAALREKERILGTFGRVVEPAVRDHLLSGEVARGGELRHATILFCDLRGFTTLAEGASPSEVVATLNEFFTATTVWVRRCGGFVDKFIGDSLLVVFGLFRSDCTPSGGAAAALDCALGIVERMGELNTSRAVRGQPSLAVTMGIHSGEVLAGTIGADDRHEYTVIGDTVNVAARLQEACKERGCDLLVSEAAFDLARSAGFTGEVPEAEPLQLRGRREPVRVRGRFSAFFASELASGAGARSGG